MLRHCMLSKLAKLLRSNNDGVPDLLDVLGLEEWYRRLSEGERQKLHEHSTAFGTGGEYNMLEQPVKSTTQTQQGYLKGVGSTALANKDYAFAEKILLKALEADDDNPSDRHFVYNSLIDLYYKRREVREDAIEKCIRYCNQDIERIDEFLNEWDGDPPRIPAFKRLAIIYENQGEYDAALEVCDEAIERGLDDGTKGGFEGRKERIKNKMG